MSNQPVYFGPRPPQQLNDKMRHGFDEDYNSENFLNLLANTFYIYFDDKRQNTNGNPITQEMKRTSKYYKNYQPISDWKVMKERQKTISAVLVLCLNLGVDPPDIMKTYPCAKYEAWCDPSTFTDTKKAIENIGKNLQSQYETLSLRTRYKQSLDPCVEDVKRFCNTLRRNAKDERILFHYNGHGVPQPTASGEIWVFNRGYTQYIPISLYDLQTWLGAPVLFVYDCNSAGNIVHNFKKFVQKRIDDDNDGNHDTSAPSPTSAYLDCIQLAACKSNELLPMTPDLPADLFTCCLTCPIDISIKWFIMQSPLKKNYYDLLPKDSIGNVIIPGKLTDRRTPLGELNWIFTAITDTIAWTSLSRPIFKRLFRQDLMVAALFRNFLLAKRIMPHLNCNPISDPPLPEAVRFHTMWNSWDLAIDQVLSQLLKNQEGGSSVNPVTSRQPSIDTTPANTSLGSTHLNGTAAPTGQGQPQQNLGNYQHSTFFEQQLTAFEIWLKYAGPSTKEPPEQLPIVLQVLLSQVHRLRALILLSKFLDLGPWAVYLSLSIGIFPYVLKLLQSPAQELKPVLIFIWARIMAIDYKSTQQELCKDKGYNYFYLILNSNPLNQIGAPGAPGSFSGSASGTMLINDDHKAMSAFILTLFIKDFKNGQRLCFSVEIINNCLKFIQNSENPLLRQWCGLLLSQLWNRYPDGKWIVYKDGYINRLLTLINDPIPEVRTSIIVAITTYLSDPLHNQQQQRQQQQASNGSDLRKDEIRQQDLKLANAILSLLGDGSSMVRKELIFFINKFIHTYSKFFLVVAFNQLEEEIVLIDNPNSLNEFRKRSPAYGSIFSSIWKALLILSEDPHCEVKQLAEILIDSVMVKLNKSELASVVKEMQDYLLSKSTINISESFKPIKPIMNRPLGDRRQVSSGATVTPRKNNLLIDGTSLTTRAASTSKLEHDHDNSDASSISSKLKGLSVSKLFKTFQINDDSEIKSFTRILNSGPVQTTYGNEYKPKTPMFKPRDLSENPQLPHESGFFEYSCEYFQEPQMSKNEIDEPGSKDYVKRLWRRNRNESIIQMTQPQKEMAVRGDWNKNISVLNNKSQPKCIKFTQFEKILVASDEKDNISVWDWEQNQIVKKFSNGNPFGTKITDIKFLNEDDLPLLLTGSSDGVIKIYKNFHNYERFGYGQASDDLEADEDKKVELIAGWRALTDLLLTSKSSGLISEWQQSRGSLLVSGDVKIIRIWDAPRELCLVDIPARSSSSITSLTSDQVAGNIFIAGFDDGSLRVYDRRLDSRESMVKTWRATSASGGSTPQQQQQQQQSRYTGAGSIRNVHMQRGGFRELVSASADGYVNLWDIRLNDPVMSYSTPDRSLRCMDVHEHAPIITTGSKSVNIWSTSGDLLTTLRNPHDKYLSNRTSSYLSNTIFHPHRMLVATNYNQDGHINVYSCSDTIVEY
ncbi:Kontroller of growth [Spathaspora passalidarum NRRL Y-27907]|uniref:Kontroller of growth n=1 Tax=Spathaspora passalidarum (strain NRRL Y-27907 / 11-Y1) TaxID=619300 RepID=G3AGK9_SPAPN|nr:Kontroller of growth [Spathaspora passalidarum NRRL Y-27907]EGW35348.1 Kontroller of growth [Spathaspora passalidarum NRRL Y-27907]